MANNNMAANDSGINTSDESNDNSLVFSSIEDSSFPWTSLPNFSCNVQHNDFATASSSKPINVSPSSAQSHQSIAPPIPTSPVLLSELSHSMTDYINERSSSSLMAVGSSYVPHSQTGAIRLKTKHNKSHFMRHVLPYNNNANERKLRLAAAVANVEMLVRLLESGVEPNCVDAFQRSALHMAACRGFVDVTIQLLKYGANPNIKDSLGNTPLHLAVCSASTDNFNRVVKILLKFGANVHAVDRMGKNPLELAKSKLNLMQIRTYFKHPNHEEGRKMLRDMSLLCATLYYFYIKQEKDDIMMNALEKKLQNLSAKEMEEEANLLLEKIEKLSVKDDANKND